jgi:trehalose utilization protein
MTPIRVTVWNEYRHEREDAEVGKVYPQGIHEAIATHLRGQGLSVRTATLDEPEHGLSADALAQTDVLVWWGHQAHREVANAVVQRVWERIHNDGMGLIALHSSHMSKIFLRLMGTGCALRWREAGEKERIWVIEPGHPIAQGLPAYFEIPHTEMYGEHFEIPAPDALIFISWFQGGEVFRSGCCWQRGNGKVFYFRPGHETLPIYHQPEVLQVITNAVYWAAPSNGPKIRTGHYPEPLEKLG